MLVRFELMTLALWDQRSTTMLKTLSYRCKKKTLNKIVFKLLGKKIIIDHFLGDFRWLKAIKKTGKTCKIIAPTLMKHIQQEFSKNIKLFGFPPCFKTYTISRTSPKMRFSPFFGQNLTHLNSFLSHFLRYFSFLNGRWKV